MTRIIVAGLINIETTLRIDNFPLDYHPQHFPFWGVRSSVSGVGYNVARALTTLGDQVALLGLLGDDLMGDMVQKTLAADGIDTANLLTTMPQSPQSVIVYDAAGRRSCFTDLKDIQDRQFPSARFVEVAAACQACVICNINFGRGLLADAKRLGKLIATDIHTIGDLNDPFNRDFMAAADILFCSNERLPVAPEQWVKMIAKRYNPLLQVVGLGDRGALLFERGAPAPIHMPAVHTRPVVNTIGAGDALFSAFMHSYLQSGDAHQSLQMAILYASWKVGGNGGADGQLTGSELSALADRYLVR